MAGAGTAGEKGVLAVQRKIDGAEGQRRGMKKKKKRDAELRRKKNKGGGSLEVST